MNFGEKIIYLREERELTQTYVAKELEINRVQYNQYENDYNNIPLRHLNSICNFYDVSIDYIFGLNESKKYYPSKKEIDLELIKTRLKEFRKEKKLTQKYIANKLNISRTTITEYERGTNLVSTPYLYYICKTYNISADYLLGKIDKKPF